MKRSGFAAILAVTMFTAFASTAMAEDRKTIFDSDAAKHVG